MLSMLRNFFLNNDKYVLFIYLFLLLMPWNLIKSQVAIFSLILLVWGLVKYKQTLGEKLKILYKFKPLLLFISFVLYSFISVFWSDSFREGFYRVFNFHKYEFLFAIGVLLALSKEQALTAIKVLLLSFSAYSIFTILVHFNILSVAEATYPAPEGFLRFSISTQYMVMSIFIALFFMLFTKNRVERVLYFLISSLSLFALFINYSRASQLAFFLVLLVFIVIFFFKNIKWGIAILALFILILLVVVQNEKMVAKFNVAVQEIEDVIEKDVYSGSFGARLYFNKAGIEIIKKNFFFGMGPVDNRKELVKMEQADAQYKFVTIEHFHSEHMEILTAYGFIGYMLILSAITLLIYKLRGERLHFYIAMSIFLTLFFVSLANKTLALKPLNYVYVILFLLLSILAYKQEQKTISQ